MAQNQNFKLSKKNSRSNIRINKAKGDDGSDEYIERLGHAARTFFQRADVDGGGTISPLEFAKSLKKQGKRFVKGGHSRGKSWFSAPMGLYQKIDEDGSGEIDIDEFEEFVLSDRCNIMLKELLMGTDDKKIKSPKPPPGLPPPGPLAPLPELMSEEDLAREKALLDQAARDQAARDQAARDQAARGQAARDQAARDQAERDRLAKLKVVATGTTKNKGAKRRATEVFVADPTMTTKGKNNNSLEEVELQMLRGIFAAHDENKDGIINKSQLAEALVSLGFSPSEKLMTKFYLENAKHQHGNKNWRFSLEIFLAACSKYLDTADDCASDVIYLFEQFDKAQTRDVSGQVLRHLLHEAIAPTRLSRQETDEFMAYAEVGSLRSKVDYEALVDKLMF